MPALASLAGLAQRAFGLLAITAALVFQTGCTTLGYLAQAGAGQVDIALRARRIVDVIADPKTDPALRDRLYHVASIKAFGERQGLRATRSYTHYVALERPVVVYVVTACEPLRFQSKRWTFPIVGSVPYLGWFSRDSAHAFAEGLRNEGWDADVGGASAYSTLGWFHDPILSTMIADGEEALGELAEVVLHESLHATIYINGQSSFNESLASFVGEELGRAYLEETLGPSSREQRAYEQAITDSLARRAAMHAGYERLRTLYASSRTDDEKRREKASILAALRAQVGFKRPINNATLAELKTYHSSSPEMSALLAACGGSFPRFLGALKSLDARSFSATPERDPGKVVKPLIEHGCKGGRGSIGVRDPRTPNWQQSGRGLDQSSMW